MKVPVLVFDNIMLRDIKKSDAKDLFEYGSDLEVVKYLNWGPYEYEQEAKEAISTYFLTRPSKGLPVGYAIIDLEKNKMIGTVDFHTFRGPNTVELGYALNKNYWNRGVMSKCVAKILEVGFYTLGYDKIYCGYVVGNPGSQRVIEKNKFKFEYNDPKGYFDRFTGETVETRFYSITKEEFVK